MKVTKISQLDGQEYTMDLNITLDQLASFLSGTLVQRAFPHLSAPEREFLVSGITPEAWENAFGLLEDDEDE